MDGLILKNISELATCRGSGPRKGSAMNDAGVIENGCIVIEKGRIAAVDTMGIELPDYPAIDCRGHAVIPGMIDPHTHFVFAGSRHREFEMRLKGTSYMEIMKEGGGIASTVAATREATLEELVNTGLERAAEMLSFGVTTAEGKSGYGLDMDTELKQLRAMKHINERSPVDIVTTFMGAHAVPDEYKNDAEAYLEFILEKVLPEVKRGKLAEFVDIFCEEEVFDIGLAERYLKKAAWMGFSIKLHADEIKGTGGAELAARLNAVSADHLLKASKKGISDMASKDVITTLLPATAFCLREEYADARGMIDAGCAVALATDFNPGSSFTNSMPLVMALAAFEMKMSVNEIINAVTINAACALKMDHEIGSIEEGKKADIVILKKPSLAYLAYNTGVNQVMKVIKGGTIVYG